MLVTETKQCGVCKATKSVTDFYFERRRNAPKWECKSCSPTLAKRYPESRLAAVKRNRAKYPDRAKAVDQRIHRKRQLRRFGITEEDLKSALIAQGGLCAICRTTEVHLNGGRQVHIDHCHQTQTFRGILCLKCNVVLGMAEDSPERLIWAAEYLKKHSPILEPRK
jgi:hypothetical protein